LIDAPCYCETISGKIRGQKNRFAEAITKDIMTIAQCEEKSVSVAIEEIDPAQWAEKVYRLISWKTKPTFCSKIGFEATR
jgi:phenylpyruvate tautomerase PptA (4-oxalocrotonate tautomerase family)